MEEVCYKMTETLQKIPWGEVIQCICAIAAFLLSVFIFKFNRESKKREYAIALFDKRYSIIESFSKVFKYSEIIKESDLLDNRTKLYNHQMVCDRICDDSNIRAPRTFRAEHNALLYAISSDKLTSEQRHKKDMELMWLDIDVDNSLKAIRRDLLSRYALSEYCFENDYSSYLMDYVDSLFDYIAIFRDGSAVDEKRSTKKVIDSINAIKTNMVLESMKTELKLLN